MIDPAVGSGAFALGMLNEIVRARQNISAYLAITMNPYDTRIMYQLDRSPHKLKYETIKNCIFAADIEPSAVDIAQLRLWLSLVIDDEINPDAQSFLDGHKNPLPLPNLDCNILCGNSLIDEFEGVRLINESDLFGNNGTAQYDLNSAKFASLLEVLVAKQDELFKCDDSIKKKQLISEINDVKDNIIMSQLQGCSEEQIERYKESTKLASKPYVLWQLDFARVFKEKGGFDIVIGNPPYRLCQPSNTSEYLLDYYKKQFKVASYKIDLFHLFFEKGICILKKRGELGYITPNTYLTNRYIKPLRKYIMDECTIHTIVNHDKVFTAASVDTATIIMTKEFSEHGIVTVYQSKKFEFEEICKKDQALWRQDTDLVFNINKESVVELQDCVKLGDVCKTYFGIQAYDRKTSISESKLSDDYLPFIDGGDIHPYSYAKPKIFFNYLPEKIKSGGDWKVYSQERVVVRQIGQIPIVGLSKEEVLASNTLYSVFPKDGKYHLYYILACLNCSFIKNYWSAKYSDNKALFPKIKGFQLKELPIPRVTIDEQRPVVDIVRQILEKKNMDSEADTANLESEIDNILNKVYGI